MARGKRSCVASAVALAAALVGLTFLPGLAGCFGLGARIADGAFALVREAEGGLLAEKDGIPVVFVRGTAYEMGLQQGALLSDLIAGMCREWPPMLLGTQDPAAVSALVRDLEASLPATARDEMRGVADGSGLSYDEILLLNLAYDALYFRGCSQFVVTADLTGDQVVHGRNVDLDIGPEKARFLQAHSPVVIAQPDEGLPFISLFLAGLAGAYTAMNSEGFVLAHNAIPGTPTNRHGLALSFACRPIVETCRTWGEASAALQAATPLSIGGILVFSDPGGAVVVDFSPEQCMPREPTNGWLVATNHNRWAPPQSESVRRYDRLVRGVRKVGGPLSASQAIALLDLVAATPRPTYRPATFQAVVFIPASREMYVSVTSLPATRGTFVRFDLKESLSWADEQRGP